MLHPAVRRIVIVMAFILVFLAGAWLSASGFINEFLSYREDISYLAVQHMYLTAVSGGLAILFAIPLGVLLSRPQMEKRRNLPCRC
ncbi:hypothetical protein [Marinobacter gelidimuriae]|uniref:hypothetical protein n=1 Tax=Marinobacter gelidimuriae TaxID=2739064 RepID=UPI0003A188FD|nr:hypothetical protein [Marinobacter gelidimuriae]